MAPESPDSDGGGEETESSEESTDSGRQEPFYCPKLALKLRESSGSSYEISITHLVDNLALEPGDYLFPGYEQDEHGDVYVFTKIDDPGTIENIPGQSQPELKIKEPVEGSASITFPARFITESLLGTEASEYDGSRNPLVFYPEFEPGGEIFALRPLGRSSELFRDPDEYKSNPIPNEVLPTRYTRDQFVQHTSYTPTQDDEADTIEAEHIVELNKSLTEETPPGDVAFEYGDVVGVSHTIDESYYFRDQDGWTEISRGTMYNYFTELPSSMTRTLFERAGFHSGYEPYIVERNGERYEIHFVEPGAVELLALHVYRVSPEYAVALDKYQFRAGIELFTELYDARGEEPPTDHYAFSGRYEPVVLPVGKAQEYQDTEIAVNVEDPIEQLRDDIGGTAQATDSTTEGTDDDQQTLDEFNGIDDIEI